MRLLAWRNTCPNPCDDPQVNISIAPVEGGGSWNVFPWVLPLEQAQYMFGPVVDKITEEPVEIVLSMSFVPKVTPGVAKVLKTMERMEDSLR